LIEHDRFVKNRFQLAPFGVLPGKLQTERSIFEVSKNYNLGFEFCERPGGGRLIEDLFFRRFCFGARDFVDVVGI
jgi:hypothetical protein